MVVSKRCKICGFLDANNVPISGEHFGKLIPELIKKICGIELDARKANGVLICQQCIVQLMLTDVVIEKFQSAVHRLKKNVNGKSKTPLKDSSRARARGTVGLDKNNDENGNINESSVENPVENKEKKIEMETKTPKKLARRKSVYLDEKLLGSSAAPNITLGSNTKFVKLPDELAPTKIIKKPAKRKLTCSSDDIHKVSSHNADDSIFETINKTTASASEESPMENVEHNAIVAKCKKTTTSMSKDTRINNADLIPANQISVNDEAAMDLTVEQDGNERDESKTKLLNCIICDKTFHSKSSLRVHIETDHVGERLKACPNCSSEFRSHQKYESHIFSEKCKNAIHACQYPTCNKRFKTVSRMESHMQEKHTSQN